MSDEENDQPVQMEVIPPIRYKQGKKLQLTQECLDRISTLAQLQCTQKEAAGALGVSEPTLERFIQQHPEATAAWWEGKQHGKVSLRRILWNMAKSNPQVAMFLAKDERWLKMAEKKSDTFVDQRTIVFTDDQNKARIQELLKLAQERKTKDG